MPGFSMVKKVARRIGGRLCPRPLVLCYHHVHGEAEDHFRTRVSPKNLEQQLAVLREKAEVVSLERVAADLGRKRFGARSVAITFDDGYANNLHRALPLLEKYDCAATVYVIAGALGRRRDFWWDELAHLLLERPEPEEELTIRVDGVEIDLRRTTARSESLGEYFFGNSGGALGARQVRFLALYDLLLRSEAYEIERILGELRVWAGAAGPSDARDERRMLNEAELLELSKSGLISVGGHTMSHPFLTAVPIKERWEEIRRCKEALTDILGRTVESFAYPFGDFDASTMALADRAGYRTAVTCEAGGVRRKTGWLRIPRLMVGDWPGDVFEEKLREWWRVEN